jgi:hypothetical protein
MGLSIDLEDSTNWVVMWVCITICCCAAMTFAWLYKSNTRYDCTNDIHSYQARYDFDGDKLDHDNAKVLMAKGVSDEGWTTSDQNKFIELCKLDQGKYLGEVCDLCGKWVNKGVEKE